MQRYVVLLPAMVLAGALVACAPTVDIAGYVPNETMIAEIVPGETTRETVLTVLGSPSSTATFDTDSWYYISRTTETLAFFDATVLDQTVLAVDFDEVGVVTGLRRYTLDDARDIVPADGRTPTRGRELGLLEQLIGNIGRYRPPPQ